MAECYVCRAAVPSSAPYKTVWPNIGRPSAGDERRLYCSEKCMRESIKAERVPKFQKRALAFAACCRSIGASTHTAELVWRKLNPQFAVWIYERMDVGNLALTNAQWTDIGYYSPIYCKWIEYC